MYGVVHSSALALCTPGLDHNPILGPTLSAIERWPDYTKSAIWLVTGADFPCSHPKLITRDGKVKFHPKSVNCDETYFNGKYLIYHTKVKSSAVFIHDSSLIPPFPLLFFGGDISMKKDAEQETIAVDDWIVFQASQDTAELVKVHMQHILYSQVLVMRLG